MERSGGVRTGFLAAAAAVVALAVIAPDRTAGSGEPCCFANERYAGICSVTPSEGETCATVLDYLNNPMSTGKSYCGGTDIRGGWTRVECGKPGAMARLQRPEPALAATAPK